MKKLALAALAAVNMTGCQPSVDNKPVKNPENVVSNKKRALESAKVSFHNDPEMVCITGDKGVEWVRGLYRKMLLAFAEKHFPHKKHTIFTQSTDKNEDEAPQCIAGEEKNLK